MSLQDFFFDNAIVASFVFKAGGNAARFYPKIFVRRVEVWKFCVEVRVKCCPFLPNNF